MVSAGRLSSLQPFAAERKPATRFFCPLHICAPLSDSTANMTDADRAHTAAGDPAPFFCELPYADQEISSHGRPLVLVTESPDAYDQCLGGLMRRYPLPRFYMDDVVNGTSDVVQALVRRVPQVFGVVGNLVFVPNPYTSRLLLQEENVDLPKLAASGHELRFVAWWVVDEWLPKVYAWMPPSRCFLAGPDGSLLPLQVGQAAVAAGTSKKGDIIPLKRLLKALADKGQYAWSGIPKPCDIVTTVKDLRAEHLATLKGKRGIEGAAWTAASQQLQSR